MRKPERDAMRSGGRLDVVQVMRYRFDDAFSIERVFRDVAAAMPARINLHSHTLTYPSKGVFNRIRAGIEARRLKYRVVHITGDVHFIGLFLPRRRTVLTVHDCVLLSRSRGLKRWVLYVFWFLLPIWRAGIVTAISDETRRQILDVVRCPPEKIRVIPDPLSRQFRWSPKDRWPVQPRLLHIGTKDNKNLLRTIEAVAGLDVRLSIVGPLDGRAKALLERLDVRFDNVQDLSDDEVVAQYLACDALLFVSTQEGFGLPILEAQAVGRPVVTSDRSPMRDVAGDGALLVDPEDVADIRSGIAQILGDAPLRAALVAAGRENAARYSPETVAAAYAAIYEELAGVSA